MRKPTSPECGIAHKRTDLVSSKNQWQKTGGGTDLRWLRKIYQMKYLNIYTTFFW